MDYFIQILKSVQNVNWSPIITALAELIVAGTAVFALRTWKNQTRTQQQIQFLDQLTDTVHEYILAMDGPVQLLELVKIHIEAYSETAAVRGESDKHIGMINYIEKQGAADQIKFNACLMGVRPITSRLNSLATKGQVMGLKDYKQCQDACKMLAWSHGQIEAFAAFIGSGKLNWQNEQVMKTLETVMTVDPKIIKENLERQNSVFLNFVNQSYRALLR